MIYSQNFNFLLKMNALISFLLDFQFFKKKLNCHVSNLYRFILGYVLGFFRKSSKVKLCDLKKLTNRHSDWKWNYKAYCVLKNWLKMKLQSLLRLKKIDWKQYFMQRSPSILNPNWHELWKHEKLSSLAPPW